MTAWMITPMGAAAVEQCKTPINVGDTYALDGRQWTVAAVSGGSIGARMTSKPAKRAQSAKANPNPWYRRFAK